MGKAHAAITKTSNAFEPIQEEEDELDDDDYWQMEDMRNQIEDEKAFELAFREQAQQERAMIQAWQAQCAIAGGMSSRVCASEPKTTNSISASSSGFWGHSM